LRLDPGAILGRQISVTASAIGGRPAVRETLEFAARHGVAPKVQLRPLAEANAALGEVRGKAATGPSSWPEGSSTRPERVEAEAWRRAQAMGFEM
jgi:D-arabinose 1-dehydrogenase-like Zn-dependent alcohol dehydrogenase